MIMFRRLYILYEYNNVNEIPLRQSKDCNCLAFTISITHKSIALLQKNRKPIIIESIRAHVVHDQCELSKLALTVELLR